MIKLKKDSKQMELAKAIGSKNPQESMAAQQAFAQAIGPVIQEVLKQLGTASLIYSDYEYGEDEAPVFPLAFRFGETNNAVTVWFASKAGGLPSNWTETSGELRFTTYPLESAVNFDKKFARKTYAFNILSESVDWMIQEILVKQERQAWAALLRALGEAVSNGADHIIQANTANQLVLDDFSRLITLNRRINQSFAGGTPVAPYSKGVTDIFLSPEMEEQIRGMAYNPQNTTAVPNTDESTALGLPDNVREEIYRAAGTSSIFNQNITVLNELGTSQKYNILFGNYAPAGIAIGGGNFSVSADEIILGADLSRDAFKRPVMNDGSGTVNVLADDQFPTRAEKVGFYTMITEGRTVLDSRALVGIVV